MGYLQKKIATLATAKFKKKNIGMPGRARHVPAPARLASRCRAVPGKCRAGVRNGPPGPINNTNHDSSKLARNGLQMAF